MRQRSLWGELLGSEIVVRDATPQDLGAIAAIQAASPEASAWAPRDYLAGGCLVATVAGRVAGFLAYREVGGGESEILNLAVAPEARRRGVATTLVGELLAMSGGVLFLEVRASNAAARKLYQKLGFTEAGVRQGYYSSPPEDGIVMRFQSCYLHS